MKNKEVKEIKLIIEKLAKEFQLSLVLMFGSQVSGKTHKFSDTDIAFLGEKSFRPIEIAKMQLSFSEKLKNKNIELVDIRRSTPFLLKEISDNSILIYQENPFEYDNFKIYAFRMFIDAKPLLELKKTSLNNFLKRI